MTTVTIEPVIDLTELRAACRPLLNAYVRICDGSPPSRCLPELDDAIHRLKALPRIPGRVGAAISLLANGGRSPEATVGAIELLKSFGSLRPHDVETIATGPVTQLTLF